MRSNSARFIFFVIGFLILNFSNVISQTPAGGQGQGRDMTPKGTIKGKILDSVTKSPIEFATVAIFRARDTMMVGGTTTNIKGEFEIPIRFYGSFFLKADFLGYEKLDLGKVNPTEAKPDIALGDIFLKRKTLDLKEVEIEGTKSDVELAIDKKIYNIDKDITSSTGSAAEVLQNIPSVVVDMDGKVSLRGSENVRILVDGKPSSLTGISRSAILEQIPASNIERIEVITNPSAKYDPESMAGIINIVLKKQNQKGLNGMASVNYGTWNRYTGNVNLNYSKNKWNVFGSFDARLVESKRTSKSERTSLFTDSLPYLNSNSENIRSGLSQVLRGGFDYSPDKKNSLSYSTTLRNSDPSNSSEIRYLTLNNFYEMESIRLRNNKVTGDDIGFDNNFNYKHAFKNNNHYLTIDLQQSFGEEADKSNSVNTFFDAFMNPISSIENKQIIDSYNDRNVLVFQSDYVQPLATGAKFETGIKSTVRETNVGVKYQEFIADQNLYALDGSKSNDFQFKEQTHAGYMMYSNVLKGVKYQLGARVEATLTDAKLINTGENHKKDYLDVFPSGFFSYEFLDKTTLQLSLSRRINRPSLEQLNPFSNYSDPLNYRTGNPFLDPEYSLAYEFTYLKFWKKLSASSTLYYRTANDVIRRIRRVDTTGVTTTTFENLSNSDGFGIEGSANAQVNKVLRFNTSANFSRTIIDGGNLGPQYKSDSYSWSGRFGSNITPFNGFDIQLSMNYRSPFGTPTGKIKEMYFVDLSFRKEVLKGKGNLSLRFSDPLNTQKFRIETNGSNFYQYDEFKRDSRAVYIGFSYKFNGYKSTEKRRMQQEMPRESDFEG